MTRNTFIKRVKDTIKAYDMLSKGDRVLAAVSGGMDSVCLLTILKEISRKEGIEVLVAHLDHNWRQQESERDRKFVESLAGSLGLDCVIKRLGKARKRPRVRISKEEEGRSERYRFFIDTARKKGCDVIATGHTMDDQAETVLMRILSGSSASGVSGIPPVRTEKGVKVIRPLIRTARRDIKDHLEREGQAHVEDSSNQDVSFGRNRVRREILPFLESFNPKVRRALVNFSDSIREDTAFIRGLASARGRDPDRKLTSVELKDILLQPKALRKAVFRELFLGAGGNVKKLTYRHWMDMDLLLKSGKKNKSLDLPGNVTVKRTGEKMIFSERGSG